MTRSEFYKKLGNYGAQWGALMTHLECSHKILCYLRNDWSTPTALGIIHMSNIKGWLTGYISELGFKVGEHICSDGIHFYTIVRKPNLLYDATQEFQDALKQGLYVYRMELENTEPYQLDKPVQFFTKQHNLDLCKVSGFNIGMIRAFKKSTDSEFIVYDPIDYSSWTFDEFPDKV